MFDWVRYRRRRYADDEVTFFLHCYHDPAWLCAALSSLRRAYPSSRVLVVSDGDPDPRLGSVAAAHRAEFSFEPERLFLRHFGGRVTQRMLRAYLAKPTPWLVKIDPDTKICRRIARLPRGRCLFGTVQDAGPHVSIQGGFVGYTLSAARDLYDSKLLEDPALADARATWAAGSEPLQKYAAGTTLTSTDWTVGYAATKLGIAMIAHPEVRSAWKEPQADDGRHAVVHPSAEIVAAAKG